MECRPWRLLASPAWTCEGGFLGNGGADGLFVQKGMGGKVWLDEMLLKFDFEWLGEMFVTFDVYS